MSGEVLPGFVDTHCHVDYVLEKLRLNNVQELRRRFEHLAPSLEAVVNIFCDPAAFSPSFSTWQDQLGPVSSSSSSTKEVPAQQGFVYGAFGIHPHNAKYYNDALEERIVECLKHPRAVAWGECGLDYHYNRSPSEVQRTVFARQVVMAVKLNKPLVVHSREADEDTLSILTANAPSDWPIHLHGFNSSVRVAQRLLEHFSKLFIGITGIITFKPRAGGASEGAEEGDASELSKVVEVVPLERLLLETDAPYLTPEGAKGVCLPWHIPLIAAKIAEVKGVTVQQVLAVTRANTKALYGI